MDYVSNVIVNSSNVSKEAWKYINSQRGVGKTPTQKFVIRNDSKEVDDPDVVCELFNNHFCSIGGTSDAVNYSLSIVDLPCSDCEFQFSVFQPVTSNQVLKVIQNFQPKPSAGNDDFSMKLLKDCVTELLTPITYLINLSLSEGCFPDVYKTAIIKPVLKKSDPEILDNYRPISILPAVSKVLERVVADQLIRFLEDHDLFFKNQYGFRKNRSTKLALIKFISICIKLIDAGYDLIAIFIDLCKAFDRVRPDILLRKLAALGFSGVVLKWLASYL